ncbi:MAG: hypothetical protein ACE1ZS_06865 [Candidatus Poribacteria bacterium]
MKKLTFIILSLLLLVAYADRAEAQRKKWERAGRPASLDLDYDTIVASDPGVGRRVVAILIPLLLPAMQSSQNMAAPSETMRTDDPALIVFDLKNPNVRRIFPLKDLFLPDGTSVRFIGFANVAIDTVGMSDDKEAIFEVTNNETITIGVVSHKTGLVAAFQNHALLGLRNYDGSEDGFLDMLLYNRNAGTMELHGADTSSR